MAAPLWARAKSGKATAEQPSAAKQEWDTSLAAQATTWLEHEPEGGVADVASTSVEEKTSSATLCKAEDELRRQRRRHATCEAVA